ncbi:zinc-binding protein A33-like [Aplochiton taeniatus]
MAASPKDVLEEELTCPVCTDFYRDPVILGCRHSFCRSCLRNKWDQPSQRECPVCKRRSSEDNVQPYMSNFLLRNIVEAYLRKDGREGKTEVVQAEGPPVCTVHRRRVKHFCEECQALMCTACAETDSKHTHLNLEEAATQCKIQAQQTAAQIKREFAKLHHFLRGEEEARLAALKEEEARKTGLLAESIPRVPESVTSGLINVAKHLGNLTYKVWMKMLEGVEYTPVTLDVNSAHPDLVISSVLTEVRDGQLSQQVPDNSERFDSSVSVLGSESICSGTHSWEVEVGPKKAWTLGVAKEGVTRKGNVTISPESGIWAVGLWNREEYSAGTTPLGTPLKLPRKPQRVRIRVVYDKGEVCFFDSSDMSLIYKFEERFDGPLYPYFSPCLNSDGSNPGNLKICPEKVRANVKSP